MKKFLLVASLIAVAAGSALAAKAACVCDSCGGKCCPCACEAGCC
ncbi:MAG: hypothetical protein WEB60_04940 [Terrimicrobiaceae bacterium]